MLTTIMFLIFHILQFKIFMFLVHNIIRPKIKGINATENSRRKVFFKKGFMKNFEKITGKHLCQSFFFNKVAG